MNRIELIRDLFAKTNFSTYLEIGCHSGLSFLPLECRNKIAVDPHFIIPMKTKLSWLLKNRSNLRNKYFEETSDAFFSKRKSYLEKAQPLDVALVDGLHTFQTSLNDVLHTLEYLNGTGLIIMHDCLPPHKAAAIPTKQFPNEKESDIEGWTGEWCGDVWKSIVYLRENLSESLDVCVINTDYGLGVIRIKNNIDGVLKINQKSFDEIDKMTYDEMIENRESTLNLKSADYGETIIKEISSLAENLRN